jgi:hypothetical protein
VVQQRYLLILFKGLRLREPVIHCSANSIFWATTSAAGSMAFFRFLAWGIGFSGAAILIGAHGPREVHLFVIAG